MEYAFQSERQFDCGFDGLFNAVYLASVRLRVLLDSVFVARRRAPFLNENSEENA